jgi:hypothetical protein
MRYSAEKSKIPDNAALVRAAGRLSRILESAALRPLFHSAMQNGLSDGRGSRIPVQYACENELRFK